MYAGSHLDIWEQIIRHVRRPLPLPNSGMDTLIGQDDLATCMQVSSTFNNITASILYDHAVADSTQRLFEGAAGLDTQRVHPNIRTKTENLHLIKHLYLEYHSMEVALPLKQLLLLPEKGLMTAEEGWEFYGDEHLRGGKRSAMEEMTTMFNEAFMVFRGGDENGIPIGQLESLALCSIRGEDPCWATPDAEVGMPLEFELMELFGVEELEPKIRQVQDMIPWVIVRLGVKDFCTRAAHEPLRLPAWSALPMPRDKEAVKDIRHKLAKAKERREERLSSPHRKLDIDGDGDDDIHAHGELNG